MPEVAGFNPALTRAAWGTALQQGADPVCLHGCCSEPGGPWCSEEWLLCPFTLSCRPVPCHERDRSAHLPCTAWPVLFPVPAASLLVQRPRSPVSHSGPLPSLLGFEGAHFPASLLYAGVTCCRHGLRAAGGSGVVPGTLPDPGAVRRGWRAVLTRCHRGASPYQGSSVGEHLRQGWGPRSLVVVG